MKKKMKALKLYLPAKENFEDFYKIIDYAAFLKYNTVFLEIGGAMEYKRHPEINTGWVNYTAQFMGVPGKSIEFQNGFDFPKNSIHWENGGGGYLAQEEVKQLLNYCGKYNINIIPEVPLLSHVDYLLTEHREFAENKEDPCPDSYCPENEEVYKLVFDVLDEVIEVFSPSIIHIGHDEWENFCLCEKCKGQNAAELYAKDIRRIYDYLKEKNIRTMMWGDKLLPLIDSRGVTWGGARCIWFDAKTHTIPTRYLPATCQAIDLIPKDIMIMHWSWRFGEKYLQDLISRGFEVVLGNYFPESYYAKDKYSNKIVGYCVSSWGKVDLEHFQRGNLFFALALASVTKPGNAIKDGEFERITNRLFQKAFRYFNKNTLSGNYLEICHRTDIRKEHSAFVDGNYIDKKSDLLGKYRIEYIDGTTTDIPVYYNLNIGQAELKNRLRSRKNWQTAYCCDGQYFETFGGCSLKNLNGKIYYTIVVPCDKEVKSTVWEGEKVDTLYVKYKKKGGLKQNV